MIEDLDISMKIIVIGNGRVGKSTLAVKFVKDIFTSEYKQTLGVDFLTTKKYIKKIEQEIEFYIWDTAGQDSFNAITKRYYRGADACLIVFAINDRDSFDQVKTWHSKMTQECGNIPTALVMSKIDLKNEVKINKEEAEKLAKELKMKLFQVSSKEGIQVEDCFEYLAIKYYKSKGSVSSGTENIEDIQKNKNNKDSDDIEELPSDKKIEKKKKIVKKQEENKGFQLDIKEKKEPEEKKKNCC